MGVVCGTLWSSLEFSFMVAVWCAGPLPCGSRGQWRSSSSVVPSGIPTHTSSSRHTISKEKLSNHLFSSSSSSSLWFSSSMFALLQAGFRVERGKAKGRMSMSAVSSLKGIRGGDNEDEGGGGGGRWASPHRIRPVASHRL